MQQSDTNQTSKKTSSLKKQQRKTDIANYIWCPLCKVYLQNSEAMEEHEKTKSHIINKPLQEVDSPVCVKQRDQEVKCRRESRMRGPKHVHLEYNIANLWREISEVEGTKGANFLYAATNVFVCKPCQATKHVTEVLEHVHGPEHQEAINLETNINRNCKMIQEEEQLWEKVHPAFRTNQMYIRIQDEKRMFCFLCEKIVPATNSHNLLSHVAGKNHMKNIIIYLQSVYSILTGICLNPHIQKLQQLSDSYNKEVLFDRLIEPIDDMQLRKLYSLLNEINTKDEEKHVKCTCSLCDLEFVSAVLWWNHCDEEFHKENVKNLSKSGKKFGKYVCHVCNTIMCGEESNHPCEDAVDGLFTPRICVSGYNNETKLESLYDVMQTCGAITNCALTSQEAVFEFQEREAVHHILRNRVKFQGYALSIEPLKFKEIKDSLTPVQVNPYLREILSSTEKFNCQVKKLCEVIDSACNETADRTVAAFLEWQLSKAFNKRVISYIFGSRVSGIAFPDSDVDIFADTGKMYGGTHAQEVSAQDQIVSVTTEALKAHPDCEHVIAVPKARTPIVKFKYKPTNSYCDIAFRHGLGCENTKLISFYLSLDPNIKPLIGFLKYWMQVHGLSGPKAFTSYALVWLVIFFLQQLPDINFPTVEDLQKNVETKTIAGWKCSFSDDRSALTVIRISHSMLQLVYEFFKFYSEFDFVAFVVCPLTGRPELKMMFKRSPTNLPDSMKEYVKRLRVNHYEKLCLSACCVQDPFELNHNVSKSASCDTVKRFQSLCSLYVELCAQIDC